MGRTIAAVVLGYVVMFALVFLSFSGAYMAMGADRAFQPGTYEVTPLWLGVSFALALLAAVVGGWVACRVGVTTRAPWALMGLVVVLGLLMAGAEFQAAGSAEAQAARVESTSNLGAMMSARQPLWVAFLNPAVGALGVWLGARLGRSAPPRLS